MTTDEIFKEIEERARKEAEKRIERIKKGIEERRKREDIICPYCQDIQDNETRCKYTSYWGEDGEQECQCECCNKKFIVKEEVERQFICSKIEIEGEEEEENGD